MDLDKAKEWFTKAAENGHEFAQYRLGFLFYSYYGAYKDLEKAIKLITMAAENECAPAQFILGDYYKTGKRVEKKSC